MCADRFDYIIVGTGSAGAIIAEHLSRDHRVLVLEYGGSDQSLFIQMPTALSIPMNKDKYTWGFDSEPEPFMRNRRFHTPRGKVLGGSSSINGMVFVRGHPYDFDEWAAAGAQGWAYRDCLPYFKRNECWMGGEDLYRGGNGPIHTNNGNNRQNPLYNAFIRAGLDAGYGETSDYNGYRQEGFGPMHMTVKDGVRCSTARAYLAPARQRQNLTLVTGALATRILIENKRAQGLEYLDRGNNLKRVYAGKEVILCAGVIGSPQLLQLSGIGPAPALQGAGVPVIHDLPGVGENLQDHLEVYFQFRCRQPITLNSRLGLLSKFMIGAQWFLFKTGLGATNHFESCAFIRSRAGRKSPDIQYHFLPAAIRYDGKTAFQGHGLQVHVGPNKPSSRGRITIRSADPHDKPAILFHYNATEDDRATFRQCLRLTREIMAQPALADYVDGEIQPGEKICSDSELDSWIQDNAESAYHPSCSCKMGAEDDPMAVLDSQCRVRGLTALRVVDSSIFPTIPNGNLNAPTMMVAEKAADLILGKAPLPPLDVPVWINPQWQSRQR